MSLAVGMGGVAHEFHRVTRADGPVDEGLLKLTSTKARIDVISGTSAGGLNGALGERDDADVQQVVVAHFQSFL